MTDAVSTLPMLDDPSGTAAGMRAAIAEAGPLLPLRDEEQVELLLDEAGAQRANSHIVHMAPRARGRPQGARNKRTGEIRDWLLSRYAHPLETLAQIQSRPTDVLAAELGCKSHEAMALQVRAASELAPYIEGKQPVSVNLNTSGDMTWVIPGFNAPAIDGAALVEAINADGMDAIDWSGVSIIDAVPAGDAEQAA